MTLRILRIPAAFVFGTLLLASSTLAQTHPAAPESPYGGNTVEEIIARVNDQVITRSDYERALNEMDQEARQHGATMQEISLAHKDLLRGLIDQQLWLSKGKELGITGETELIKRLNELRKQYNLETLDDLEKAAKEQGISYEDFKANIRNQIVTQLVMRDQIGGKIRPTPGEVQRYFEQHKQEYAQPESVRLSEILVSTGAPAAAMPGMAAAEDPEKLAAAKSKVDEIEAKIHAGGDFAQLARSFSDGPTGSQGGEIGVYKRGELAKVFEDKTFSLNTGDTTEPIRTKQGFIIFKVVQHVKGGVPEFKDVADQVDQTYYESLMEPAMRAYLTTMREEAYIDIKPGYTDSGASAKETKPVYSAYVPPSPKKKRKVERTRFRENARSFRQKSGATDQAAAPATTKVSAKDAKKNAKAEAAALSMKPGKKEKIRLGQAPRKTLPQAAASPTEDAGAVSAQADGTPEPVNPLEASNKPTEKSRYSARAKAAKKAKQSGPKIDTMAPVAADSAEVADRQTQAGPLGLAGDTASKKKKKKSATVTEKTRLTDKKKADAAATPENTDTPAAPAPAPAPQPKQ
jgi:peptidyl-prolyl cis-trans isomerase SurA